jgi:exodeoxyribonuclease-3
MKITTWNVNSVRRRLEVVLAWIERNGPEVLCLQETKCVEDQFPWVGFQGLGYRVKVVGQRGYNGVAIVSKIPFSDTDFNPVGPRDGSARSLAATLGGLRILNVYVPHGDTVGSDGYARKLEWFEELWRALQTGAPNRPHVVSGDFNVAPDDRDVYDPRSRREKLICSSPERAAFSRLLDSGYVDALRQSRGEGGLYTWWSHRIDAVRKNRGLRVDHHLVAHSLRNHIRGVHIDRSEREKDGASDHAPVTLQLDVDDPPGS